MKPRKPLFRKFGCMISLHSWRGKFENGFPEDWPDAHIHDLACIACKKRRYWIQTFFGDCYIEDYFPSTFDKETRKSKY